MYEHPIKLMARLHLHRLYIAYLDTLCVKPRRPGTTNSRRGSCGTSEPTCAQRAAGAVGAAAVQLGCAAVGGPGCLTLMARCWSSRFEDSHRERQSASKINRQFSSPGYMQLWPQRSHQY